YAEFGRLGSDPSHALNAKRPPRSFGRRAHATIIAAQVAVEVRVEPKAGADGPIFSNILRSFSVPQHPTGASVFDCCVDQIVVGEATPCLERRADARVATNQGNE